MKTGNYSTILLLIIVICAINISPTPASCRETPPQTVLVLHSYHRQLSWVKSIENGILTYFKKENPSVELRFEYMDTKRITEPTYFQMLYEHYRFKFKDVKFDVIICSDNNALNFLLENNDKLFPGTPVVFCGINNFNDAMIAGKKLFTGTVEGFSFKETLDVAIKLHPGTKNIFFYGDNSPTYHANKALVEQIADKYKSDLKFHFIDNIPIKQIQNHIRNLDPDSLILLGTTIRDENGILLSFEKATSMMEEVSSVPIYGCWDFYLDHGIVGGNLINGFSQGEIASRIANRILSGESVTDIPVIRKSPNQYMFDNNQLEKFNIDHSRLPPDSIIINRQLSFYAHYKVFIVSVISIVAILLFINVILIFNIRRRKRAEKKLAASEQKYRNLLESTSTVPWELDLKSEKFTYMGKQIEQILGYPVESWTDINSWTARIHPEDQSGAVTFCKAETQKGHDHDFVYRAVHMDGSFRWIRDIVSVVTDNHESAKLVGFMHDITRQKTLSLEKETLESRLQQAQKMEAIGTLAGGIAHDFNNILAVIMGYAEMAKEDAPPGARFEKDLEKILIAANRAKHLVEQILSFSHQADIERIPIKIQPLIKEGLKMLRSSIPTTISIIKNIDSESGIILADPTQVHQILMNLCTNAYHTMEETGGELSVTLKTTCIGPEEKELLLHVSPGEYVELTVADTGVGMGPDVIEKIFDPYFTTKEIGKGTGLGLAIIHGIMKDYDGTITVESQLDKGSIFHVYFPVIKEEILDAMKESGDIPGGKERILFIDDEELLAEMGRDMLERLGYHVTVRRNSLEALNTFQNTPGDFDLVITDQTMPDMTGVDLSRRMLQIKADIPIILCTGYSNLIDEESAKTIGIKEFALKPLTKKVTAKLIRKVLDGVV